MSYRTILSPAYHGWTEPEKHQATVKDQLQEISEKLAHIADEALTAESFEFWFDILTVDAFINTAINKLNQMSAVYQHDDNNDYEDWVDFTDGLRHGL